MRAAPLLVAALLVAVATTACTRDASSSLPRPSKPFCEAAHRYDVRVEKLAPISEQINIVQKMADHAPRDIAKDTETFLDALQRRAAGDKSVVDNAKIKVAVDNVNRRAARGCLLYKQEPGGGI
jgi:hypothetical protein